MMGLIRSRRKGRRDEDEIDLLTTAFNLPNRYTLERDERRRAGKDQQYVFVARHNEDDDDEDDDDSNDITESDSNTAVESIQDSELVESSSEEEEEDEIFCKKTFKTPPREARPSSPSISSVNPLRFLHRRLHSEPQKKCSKPVETEAARTPASEPRSSRQAKRRETKLKDKELRKASRKSTSFEGSPTPRPTADLSHKSRGSAPAFVQGPLPAAQTPFLQPHMYSTVSQPPLMSYPAHMAPNHGVYMDSGLEPRFGTLAFAQQQNLAEPQHLAAPWTWNTSGAGAPPMATTKATELQRIQDDLDEVTKAMKASPNELSLQTRAAALRNLLNSTLNSAMYQTPSSGNMPLTKTHTLDGQADVPPKTEKKEERKDGEATHHSCNECGSLRSRKYHELHPLAPGKRKHPGLCEGCRETHHKSGTMGDKSQHICFGCGIFRSSAFNKQHPLPPGKPLLVNYCGRCKIDMQDWADHGSSAASTVSLSIHNTPAQTNTHSISNPAERRVLQANVDKIFQSTQIHSRPAAREQLLRPPSRRKLRHSSHVRAL